MNGMDPIIQLNPSFPSLVTRKTEILRVTAFSSIACSLSIELKFLGQNGKIQDGGNFVLTHTGNYIGVTKNIPLTDAILYSVNVRILTGTVSRGECFVKGEIFFGEPAGSGQARQTILSGYVTTNFPISFPFNSLTQSFDGHGKILVTYSTGLTPRNFQVPVNTVWRIQHAKFLGITSSVAGSRYFELGINDGTDDYLIYTLPLMQGASESHYYYIGDYETSSSFGINGEAYVKIPDLYLYEGFIYSLNFSGARPGDNGNGYLLIESWLNV